MPLVLIGHLLVAREACIPNKSRVFAARGGHADSMQGIKIFGSRRFGLSDDEIKDIERNFEDIMKLEWTDDRQEMIEDRRKARNGEPSVMYSSMP